MRSTEDSRPALRLAICWLDRLHSPESTDDLLTRADPQLIKENARGTAQEGIAGNFSKALMGLLYSVGFAS